MAAHHVGGVDGDLAVEAARAQQRRVEDVGAVGRRDEDDVGLDVEAVHLDQQLVEGLLALVVATAEAGAAVAADGVDLVDEDDGGGVVLGLLEQVTHPGGTDTDEHLDEVRAGDRVERDTGLAGHGAGQQGLAGAGLAVEQDALGDLGADGEELGRLGEELLDLAQLLDRLVSTGHVGEGHLGGVLGRQLGLALAEAHHLGAAALHLAHEEPEQAEHEDERDDRDEQAAEPVGAADLVGVAVRRLVRLERLHEAVAALLDVVRLHPGGVLDAVTVGVALALLQGEVDLVHLELGGLHLAVVDQLLGRGGVDAGEPAGALEGEEQHADTDDEHHPDHRGAKDALEVHVCAGLPAPSLLIAQP